MPTAHNGQPHSGSDGEPLGAGRDRSPLKVALLIAGHDRFENWHLMAMEDISRDPRLTLAAVLVHPTPFGTRRASTSFSTVSRLERGLLARPPRFQPRAVDLRKLRHEPLPLDRKTGHIDPEATRRLIEEIGADLVLRTTPEGLPNLALRALPHGEWAFNFADEWGVNADWYGYAPVMRQEPTTSLALYARHEGEEPHCIVSTAFSTKFSGARNNAYIKERAAALFLRELRRVADQVDAPTAPEDVVGAAAPPPAAALPRYAATLARELGRRARKAVLERLGHDPAMWTLYLGQGSIDAFDPQAARQVPPTPTATDTSIRADPFLFEQHGACYLFYETYSHGDTNAHIAVGRLDEDGLTPLGEALRCPYHLSYPFVFRDGEDIFMMPETHAARRIEIWRCTGFPHKWELYASALEGQSAADSVLVRLQDKWWLFTNLSTFHAYEDHCCELHVFQVDGPRLGRLVPHRRNPVVMGSLFARNAGRIFDIDGKIYRPSQQNSHGIYGYGLNIMEIEQLDLLTYRERCVRTILPDFKPELLGCHHFDAAGGRFVLDARLSI